MNGKSLSVTLNPRAQTITWEVPGMVVLSVKDKQALKATAVALSEFLEADSNELVDQEALLTRNLVYLSQAPEGYKLRSYTKEYSLPTASDSSITSAVEVSMGRSAVTDTKADARNCEVANGGLFNSSSELFGTSTVYLGEGGKPCQLNDEDGVTLLPCGNSYNNASHDARGHCFTTESVRSGPSDPNDVGRCGPSNSPILVYGYTQDCLDHDRCVGHEGAGKFQNDEDCGDEFYEADDDFFFTYRNQCDSSGQSTSQVPGAGSSGFRIAASSSTWLKT